MEKDILTKEELEKAVLLEKELLSNTKNNDHIFTTDQFNDYIKEISKFPLLSSDEERQLLIKNQQGDKDAKKRLIECNLRLVVYVAKWYLKNVSHLQPMDLIQEGNIGLMKALDHFDAVQQNVRFSTYGIHWIQQSISRSKQSLEDSIRTPIPMHRNMTKYLKYKESYIAENDKSPSDQEIIDFCGFTKKTLNLLKESYKTKARSLQEIIGDEEELETFVPTHDPAYGNFDNQIDTKALLVTLKNHLTPIHYYILYYRVFETTPLTLREIAQELGKSSERIRQLEIKCLKKVSLIIDYNQNMQIQWKKENPFEKYTISFLKKQITTPPRMKNKIIFAYLKDKLVNYEYYILYHYFYKASFKSTNDLSALLHMSISEIKSIITRYEDKLNDLSTNENFQEFYKYITKSKTIEQLFELDISPNSIIDYPLISDYFCDMNFHTISDLLKNNNIDYENQKTLLQRYFINTEKYQIKPYGIPIAEREINLCINGCKQRKEQFPIQKLYNSYIENRERFSEKQKDYINAYIFNTVPIRKIEEKYGQDEANNSNHYISYLYSILEKVHCKIYRFFEQELTFPMVNEIFFDKLSLLTEEERLILQHYYGISKEKTYSLKEISSIVQKNYNYVHDKLKLAKEKTLRYHYLEKKDNGFEKKIYINYIENIQYELTSETRMLLRKHIIEEQSYDDISRESGLSKNRISNIIIDGIRRLDLYRYKIVIPFLIAEEELNIFYKNKEKNYDNKEKTWIHKRFFEGKTSEQISKEEKVDKSKLNSFFRSFMESFVKHQWVISKKKITPEIYKREIFCHITDSIWNVFEREFMSYYTGIKSIYNMQGVKLSPTVLSSKYQLTLNQYHHILTLCHTKCKQRELGYLVPTYGIISSESLQEMFKSPNIPIKNREKEIICHIKEICGKEILSIEEIAKRYNISISSVARIYQRSTLTLLKYNNKEIEGTYSYDFDIEPNLKYFSEFDRNILIALYKDNKSIMQMSKEFGLSKDLIVIHINRNRLNMIKIIKKDTTVNKFDFDYAKNILPKNDIPLYGNKDILLKIYNYYFGDSGEPPISAPKIREKLSLNCETSHIINIAYSVLIAVCKYKSGIRKVTTFTTEEVHLYYQKYKEKMNSQENKLFQSYFKKEQNFHKESLTDVMKYMLLKNREIPLFTLERTSRNDIIDILKKYRKNFSVDTCATLFTYYSIDPKLIMSGRDKIKVLKTLSPLYTILKKKENTEKIKKLNGIN